MGLVDRQELGRCIASARMLKGLKTQEALADALTAIGVPVTQRTVYAYEEGDTRVPFDVIAGIAAVTQPPGGLDFFYQRSVKVPAVASSEVVAEPIPLAERRVASSNRRSSASSATKTRAKRSDGR